MRVFVCGAKGNIAHTSVDKALKAGHKVTAFVRSQELKKFSQHLERFYRDNSCRIIREITEMLLNVDRLNLLWLKAKFEHFARINF